MSWNIVATPEGSAAREIDIGRVVEAPLERFWEAMSYRARFLASA